MHPQRAARYQTEVCNGVDDDCNGSVDEGFGVGDVCSVGVGACGATDAIPCDGAGAAVCSAMPGMPAAEVCDGVDNNCDGEIDEGFNLGAACTSGVGACATAGVVVCDAMGGATCDAQPSMPSVEACNGIDDDCDGVVDNGFDVGSSCTVGVGACAATGTIVCDAQGAAACDAMPGQPAAEICGNGVDDNCDGVVDDGCETGTGGGATTSSSSGGATGGGGMGGSDTTASTGSGGGAPSADTGCSCVTAPAPAPIDLRAAALLCAGAALVRRRRKG